MYIEIYSNKNNNKLEHFRCKQLQNHLLSLLFQLSANCLGKAVEIDPGVWTPGTHFGALNEAPGSCLHLPGADYCGYLRSKSADGSSLTFFPS